LAANKKTATVQLPRTLVAKVVAETVYGRTEDGQNVARDNRTLINEGISVVRTRNSLVAAVRDLDARDPIMSSAMFSVVEIAMSTYKVMAYNTQTTQFDVAGSILAEQIIAQMDTLYDYTKGFGDKLGFEATLEQCLLETAFTAGLVNELVLDKARLPDRINVIPYETINWKAAKGGRVPEQQRSQGDPVILNYPTIFVSELHRQGSRAYADGMFAAAVNPSFAYNEFLEEMRRAVRRQGHGRMTLTVSQEQVLAALPEEIKSDQKKLQAALDQVLVNIRTTLQNLNPEDAIVVYDSVSPDLLKGEGEKSDYVPMMEAMAAQLATAVKSNSSILGIRSKGSQSLSNTESLIYLKIAKAIRRPVETNISRILTLACRLYGSDVFVKFAFDPINLRPEDELEAFKTMRQQRILEQLSEGFITDEEAGWLLGTGDRAPGAPKLSGTGFQRGSKGIDASKASPNDDPQGRALQPDTPSKAGGESQ